MTKLLSHPPERLHHHAYVVRDQEANRAFVEDVLGIPLIANLVREPFQPLGQPGGPNVPHFLRHGGWRGAGVLLLRG